MTNFRTNDEKESRLDLKEKKGVSVEYSLALSHWSLSIVVRPIVEGGRITGSVCVFEPNHNWGLAKVVHEQQERRGKLHQALNYSNIIVGLKSL